MEIFIEKKFWNLVKKKVSPKNAVFITRYVKAKFIKSDFELSISKTRISNGFFEKKFTTYGEGFFKALKINDFEVMDIEVATIKVLIEKKGLSEKVKYCKKGSSDCDYIVEQIDKKFKKIFEKKGFIYFIRNEDIYKIGITDNLLRRLKQLNPDEVLNVVRCSNFESLEKDLHIKFKKYRIPQTEYFRLKEYQIEEVNNEMINGADF